MATSLNFLTRSFTKLKVTNTTCLTFLSVFREEAWGLAKQTGSRVAFLKFEAAPCDEVCGWCLIALKLPVSFPTQSKYLVWWSATLSSSGLSRVLVV